MLCQINQEILAASKIIATDFEEVLELFFYDFVIQVISKKTV